MVSDHKSTGHDDILAFTQVQDTCTTQLHVPHSYIYHTDISQYIEAYKSRGVRGEIEMEWSGCHCMLPSSVPSNSNSEM